MPIKLQAKTTCLIPLMDILLYDFEGNYVSIYKKLDEIQLSNQDFRLSLNNKTDGNQASFDLIPEEKAKGSIDCWFKKVNNFFHIPDFWQKKWLGNNNAVALEFQFAYLEIVTRYEELIKYFRKTLESIFQPKKYRRLKEELSKEPPLFPPLQLEEIIKQKYQRKASIFYKKLVKRSNQSKPLFDVLAENTPNALVLILEFRKIADTYLKNQTSFLILLNAAKFNFQTSHKIRVMNLPYINPSSRCMGELCGICYWSTELIAKSYSRKILTVNSDQTRLLHVPTTLTLQLKPN